VDEAVACCRQALELKPDYAEAYNNLGNALRDLGKLDGAIACYRRALELKPDYAEAHNNMGVAFRDLGKLDGAIACYRRALELTPDYAGAHSNLGVALLDQGKLDEAVACYRRALELKPDYAGAHYNLGNALNDQGTLDEAVACYRRALELKPDYAEAYNNLGNTLRDQGTLDEAVACCRRALELKPDYVEAHLNQSLISLLTGDFERGWAEYEWRWKTKQCQRRDFSQALWDRQPLEGRTILLHAEQGLGDTIQFVRYAPLVKQARARVLVECQKPLVRLLAGCRGVDALIGRGDDLPPFDTHAPLLSLPGIFRTSLGTIPADVPYLFAEPGLVKHWQQELGGIAGFKIGIAWRGSPEHRNDRARSIPLSCFESLAGLPGAHFFSLQKGVGVGELQEASGRFPVTELGSRLEDFTDTAAVLRNLDLVIACDTAVAHLAGALGVPVWVALPFVPDWRWLLNRSDSPWYPTMQLFQQKKLGDWAGVFGEIKTALAARPPSQE
jgi:tetratricopeptide (TPR) repeat protein